MSVFSYQPVLFLLDSLIDADLSFALFREPEGEVVLVMQHNGRCQKLTSYESITGSGFVLAPFTLASGHPLLFLRAEYCVRGLEAIAAFLEQVQREYDLSLKPQKMSPTSYAELEQRLFASRPTLAYSQALNAFLEKLRNGSLQKLVLARGHDLAGSFSAAQVFHKACTRYPKAMVSLVHTPDSGTWLTATPEILLRAHNGTWQTMALAGTHKAGLHLGWDEKNQHEQAVVADYIRARLQPICATLREEGPYTSFAGAVEHLRSDFFFTLAKQTSLAQLVAALHPTPAVCGLPQAEALACILQAEAFDRRYYAGFLGWWHTDQDTALYVNLRCLKMNERGCRLYAGGGILAASTLASEWDETCQKMRTMLALLGQED